MFLKNGTSPIIRTDGTISWSLLYLNSIAVNMRLKYYCSVISVIVDSLPGKTKNQESTRSWLIAIIPSLGGYPTLDLSLLYILVLGTYIKFARENNFLAPGVRFLQLCSSAGRRFAASRSRSQNYRD